MDWDSWSELLKRLVNFVEIRSISYWIFNLKKSSLKMLDWSTKDSRQKWLFSSGFFDFHYMCPLADKRSTQDLICKPLIFLSQWEVAFLHPHTMATLVCLPLKTACHAWPSRFEWTNLAHFESASLILDTLTWDVIIYLIIQWIAACIYFFNTTFPL